MSNFVLNHDKNDLYHEKANKKLHIRRFNSFNSSNSFSAIDVLIQSLSSTSDTNTETNNRLCACAVLEKGTVTSALEVATPEANLFLEVVVRPGIS